MSQPPATSEARARRPAIVVVDDEPAVLAAVARDLRRGFGERFVEQQHDGTLSFDTGDEGTTFRVWLPLH